MKVCKNILKNIRQQDYFEGNGNDIEHCVEYLKMLMQFEKKYIAVQKIDLKGARKII